MSLRGVKAVEERNNYAVMLAKAQRAFSGFHDVSWLVWGVILMPVMAKEAEEERKLAEAKELAELAAKEVQE